VSTGSEELQQLRHFAKRRLANPHGQQLCHYLDGAAWEEALHDRLLVPEEMSLGFYTPFWADYTEEQRLALNHWVYLMKYYRISDGERFVIEANLAVVDFLQELEPEVAGLLRLESEEERDHIAAFERVRAGASRRHGFEWMRMPVKPLRKVVISPRTLRFLLRHFGADFIATYYLGRGLLNHQGKGFETQVASLHHGHPAFTGLSRFHTVDENRHMAVSRMMAASTYTLVSRRAHTGPLYEALNQALRHTVVGYTLSARLTLQQERAMSLLVLPRMRALRGVPRERLEATVDAHFSGVSGMQRAENAYMPRFNQRLVERACLSLEEKQALVALIRSLQGNLRFFPEGYVPGREPSEGLPPLDSPESSASA
jgi:hypothetical protein